MFRSTRIVLSILAAIVLALSSVVSASAALPGWITFWKDDEYTFHGGYYDPPREVFELIDAVDQNGDPFTFEEHRGKTIFVYFGYINCPDACPATLAEWREVKAELGDKADDVVFVMVTVDPDRDTPERMKAWLEFWDPEFSGVWMSLENTRTLTGQWGVTVIKDQPDSASGYTVTHDVSTYVIDPSGQLRLTYPLGFDPADMAEDIRHLQSGD